MGAHLDDHSQHAPAQETPERTMTEPLPVVRYRCATCGGTGVDSMADTCRDCDGTGADNHGA
ncbi:hypothetical protein Skr01_74370 [Sphaerisporangium krabiense]|nr:hypothetical protein Skr01_74370 [Sphaerisporangium krabiense]